MELNFPKTLKVGEIETTILPELRAILINKHEVALIEVKSVRKRNLPKNDVYYSESSYQDVNRIITIFPIQKSYKKSGLPYPYGKIKF